VARDAEWFHDLSLHDEQLTKNCNGQGELRLNRGPQKLSLKIGAVKSTSEKRLRKESKLPVGN